MGHTVTADALGFGSPDDVELLQLTVAGADVVLLIFEGRPPSGTFELTTVEVLDVTVLTAAATSSAERLSSRQRRGGMRLGGHHTIVIEAACGVLVPQRCELRRDFLWSTCGQPGHPVDDDDPRPRSDLSDERLTGSPTRRSATGGDTPRVRHEERSRPGSGPSERALQLQEHVGARGGRGGECRVGRIEASTQQLPCRVGENVRRGDLRDVSAVVTQAVEE